MNISEGPLLSSRPKDTSNLPLPGVMSPECMQAVANNSISSFETCPCSSNVPLPKLSLNPSPKPIPEAPLSPEGPSLPPCFQPLDDCPVSMAVEPNEDNSSSPRLKKITKEFCSDDKRGQKHIHKLAKLDKMALKLRLAKLHSYSNYLKKHNAYKIRLKHHKQVKIRKKQSDSLKVKRSLDEVSNSNRLEMKSGGSVLGTPSKANNSPEKPEARLSSSCEISKSDKKIETDSRCRSSASEGKHKEKVKKKSRKRSHKSSSKKKDGKKHHKSSKTSSSRLEGTVDEKRSRSHSKSQRRHKHSHHNSSTKSDKSPKGGHKRSLKTSEYEMETKIKSPHKSTVDGKKGDSGPETKITKLFSLSKTHKSPHKTSAPHHNRHFDTERFYADKKSRKDSLILKLPLSSRAISRSNRLTLHSEKKSHQGGYKGKAIIKESKGTVNNKETPIKREQSSSESKSTDKKRKRDSEKHMGRHQSSTASTSCKERVKDANTVSERRYQSKSQTKTVPKENDAPIDRSRRSSSHQTSEEKSKRYPLKPKGSLISPFKRHKEFAKSKFRGFGHRSSHFHQKRRVRVRKEEEEDTPDLSTHASKWIKSTPAEAYYSKVNVDSKEVVATDSLKELHRKFRIELVQRAERARALKPKYEAPVRRTKLRKHKPAEEKSESESSNSEMDSSSGEEDTSMEELEKKRQHPDRLHPELWYNDPREMNDGPLCRCSAKARRSGIRHGMYMGEVHQLPCNPHSNNAKKLYHYKIAMTPVTNFLTKNPTIIVHGGHKYIFEGFSLFSHKQLAKLPNCKVIRFNYEYTLLYVEEEMPQNFTVAGLELFHTFLLQEILELVDLDWKAHSDPDGCPKFHFMPRFAKTVKGGEKELLSLNYVLEYLLEANKPLIEESEIPEIPSYSLHEWQDLADEVKGMIVTCPGMKPSSIRVDQLDREHTDTALDTSYPIIVHFGVRPPQLSYAGNPLYQKAWRDYVKYRHLLANKPKVRHLDRHKLGQKEFKLQEMRMENDLKRDVTVVITSKGFYRTGIMSDIVQHVMLLPVLVCHLRFHDSLKNLEDEIGYQFRDRFLLQLALTHPSYRENFGTNPDHARNSLTNCGLRQPQYGDRRIHYMNTRKRGINTLINIMSRFGSQCEATSNINHNERLEFLGDAVVEFLSSIHLFYMFPDLEEGGLATYRAAIVQNQHLAVLAKKLHLEKFMLYAHGSDLCHDLELRHAMANCFEALMGALFLDDGIEIADKVFSVTLFPEPELQEVWKNYPLHPLQEQEPDGDRKWIDSVPLLQKLLEFEEQIGIEFNHIRLLARSLTHRSLGYNNLTLGSNQRLEFLGDTVLQLVASEYLYKYFPQHHEGHLSLLRSSLVNNRTQAVVCGDLGMVDYAIYPYDKVELKPKDKADLLEAFLGALYVDKDLGYCRKFCEVCFFPRLQDFIMNQDWNDPKSKLQQCCLTLRSMDGGEPDIPTYKVIECKGPTNTRVYAVAVYFQGNRLAVGSGHSIQQAEMDAASNALEKSKDLFPQLKHQKRAIERSLKQGKPYKLARRIKASEHKSTLLKQEQFH